MKYIKGLRIDWDSGEGEIAIPKEFHERSYLFQFDVLSDWMWSLKLLHEEVVPLYNQERIADVVRLIRLSNEEERKRENAIAFIDNFMQT
jgi:hypothetical protein